MNSLLRSQSANSSPLIQGQSSTPKAEAGTNTGQSLFWPTSTTPTSSQRQNSNSTATASTEAGSQYDEENSVCSSAMADLSMQTATSILSQGVSEMHLDLQSYGKQYILCSVAILNKCVSSFTHTLCVQLNTANSPTSSHSQSFGDSASTAGYRAEGSSSHQSSPASLLFKDQHQFYQNMLVREIFRVFGANVHGSYIMQYFTTFILLDEITS